MVSGAFVLIVDVDINIFPTVIPLVPFMCGTWLTTVDQYVFPVLLIVVNLILLYPLTVPFTSLVGE